MLACFLKMRALRSGLSKPKSPCACRASSARICSAEALSKLRLMTMGAMAEGEVDGVEAGAAAPVAALANQAIEITARAKPKCRQRMVNSDAGGEYPTNQTRQSCREN